MLKIYSKCLIHILKVKYTEFTLQQFRLCNGLPAVRPSSTMAGAPFFPHNKGNRVGFTNPLSRKMFIHCATVLPFILY